ncbi:hypothetical protein ABH935_008589 [Catenulispora sp. GAS73]
MEHQPATAEKLDEIAGRSAAVLVGSFATQAFEPVRTCMARLFTGEPTADASVVAQLDADNRLVGTTDIPAREPARAALMPAWRLRLSSLLRDDPGRAPELDQVLAAIGKSLPNARPVHEQHNTAHDASTLYAVMYGSLHHHQGVSGRVAPAPGPDRTDTTTDASRGGTA